MPIFLQRVHASPGYTLELILSNGEHRLFDATPYLDKGIFKALRDPHYFDQVQTRPHFVEWPQGQDLSLDTLLMRSTLLSPANTAPLS